MSPSMDAALGPICLIVRPPAALAAAGLVAPRERACGKGVRPWK